MSNGAEKYTPRERNTAFQKQLLSIRGVEDTESVYDAYDDLELTDFKADLEKRLESATLNQRTKLHFDLALYRSLRYAACSSKHCLVLGAVNNLRELYEGSRLLYPSLEVP